MMMTIDDVRTRRYLTQRARWLRQSAQWIDDLLTANDSIRQVKKRHISAAGRARIAAAQRARWAKTRRAKKARA